MEGEEDLEMGSCGQNSGQVRQEAIRSRTSLGVHILNSPRLAMLDIIP